MITDSNSLVSNRIWYVLNSDPYELVKIFEYISKSKTRYALLYLYWWKHSYTHGSTSGFEGMDAEFSGTIGFKSEKDLMKFKLACPGKFTLVKHH